MTFPSESAAALGAGLAAAALLCAAPAAPAQERPSESERSVRVQEGDTLWGLAGRHLGSPERWPLIHRANADRLADPHSLRPGMELVLPAVSAAEPGRVDAGDRARQARDEAPRQDAIPRVRLDESLFAGDEESVLGELTVSPVRVLSRISPTEFSRSPFLYEPEEGRPPIRTLGWEGEAPGERHLSVSIRRRDRVRLSAPSRSVEPGDRLQAIRWEERVPEHGRVARPVAILRVVERSGGDTLVAEVARLYGLYRVEDPVLPLPEVPGVRGGESIPAETDLTARLVGPAIRRPVVVPGSTLFLDVGSRSGVRPGDEFVVPGRAGGSGSVEGPAARLRVIRTEDRSSTVRVLQVRDPDIASGSEARLDRRLASGGEG